MFLIAVILGLFTAVICVAGGAPLLGLAMFGVYAVCGLLSSSRSA